MADGPIAVFGGSFDPPHLAHLEVLRLVLGRGLAGLVLVVPCIRHPFDKRMAAFEHRLSMCRLLCSEAGARAQASDVERRLGLSGYTVDTLEALGRENPGRQLRLVIGSDILAERDRWHRFADIETIAPPIIVAREGSGDPGTCDLPAPRGICSSEVRGLVASGGSAGDLVPAGVLAYIEDHDLYR